jgi:hypothetical protein
VLKLEACFKHFFYFIVLAVAFAVWNELTIPIYAPHLFYPFSLVVNPPVSWGYVFFDMISLFLLGGTVLFGVFASMGLEAYVWPERKNWILLKTEKFLEKKR